MNPPLPVRIRCINTQYRASTRQLVVRGGWSCGYGTLGRIYISALKLSPCTNNPFIHFVYGNHDLVARGGWSCGYGRLGQIYIYPP